MPAAARRSPLHAALTQYQTRWGVWEGMPVALDLGEPEAERSAMERLALADWTAVRRLALKGPSAVAFLAGRGVTVPETVLHWHEQGAGGLIGRTGAAEVFLESGLQAGWFDELEATLASRPAGVYRVLREDACLLLLGRLAMQVLAEACPLDWQAEEGRLVFTRVAGVSCMVLHRPLLGHECRQIWVDNTYARYLWETLLAIVQEHGGRAVGLGPFVESRPHEG